MADKPEERSGFKQVAPPLEGRIVSMIEHKGRILIATEFGLYEVKGETLVPMPLVLVE